MLEYCDYIADRLKKGLSTYVGDYKEPVVITRLGSIKFDLDASGAYRSSKKTMEVVAENKIYKVTVECIGEVE